MLSYRHAYHAGNHADILKHCTLMLITRAFCKKDKPFVYFDTHAGAALYALDDERSLQTGEAQNGIIRVIKNMPILAQNVNGVGGAGRASLAGDASLHVGAAMPLDSACGDKTPATPHTEASCEASYIEGINLVREYTSFCEELYRKSALYPGSPAIVSRFARAKDELVLMERHNTEIEVLRQNVKTLCTDGAPRIHVHHRNGFELLRALTPPKPPLCTRGFVLIDPSYETDDDFTDCAETILAVNKRWRGGTVAVWYPLLRRREAEIAHLKDTCYVNNLETLCAELIVDEAREHGLYGSGMLVINPTWQLEEQLRAVLPVLCSALLPHDESTLETDEASVQAAQPFKPVFSLSVVNRT